MSGHDDGQRVVHYSPLAEKLRRAERWRQRATRRTKWRELKNLCCGRQRLESYLFEVLQVSAIFDTLDTLNVGCEAALELLGLGALLELVGLVLDGAAAAL
jgi:hypothetical protein